MRIGTMMMGLLLMGFMVALSTTGQATLSSASPVSTPCLGPGCSEQTSVQTCYDPDGADFYVQRWVNFTNASGSYGVQDSCQSGTTVKEWTCTWPSPVMVLNTCTYGCSNGACNRPSNLSQYPRIVSIGGFTNPDGGIINFNFTIVNGGNDAIQQLDLESDAYFYDPNTLTWLNVGSDTAAPWIVSWNTDNFAGIQHFSGTTVVRARLRTANLGWGPYTDMYPVLIQN